MTREEAIARIKNHKIVHKMNEPRAIYISEALDMAIKALEQEPCGDCISRQAVIELCDVRWLDDFAAEVRALPSVTPAEKVGRWMLKDVGYDDWCYKCSECGEEYASVYDFALWKMDYKYCPNCGAKMEGVNGKD